MVGKTDNTDSATDPPGYCGLQLHDLTLHRVNAMEEFFSMNFRTFDSYILEHHSHFHCCHQRVSPAAWPLFARLTNYVPPSPTPEHSENQRPKTNGVNASSPSTSTSTNPNQNGDAMVQEDDKEVCPEKETEKQDEPTPAPEPTPVVEVVVEPAPEAVPRPCSVIRHVSSDSLASLAATPEPSPVISPCSSVSPSPVPAPTSANDNSADDIVLPPLTQPSSNVDSSTLNQDQPSLPEDDNQSGNSTDTELTPENLPAINDVCEDEDISTIPESRLADQVTVNEPGSATEAPDRNIGLENIKAEVDCGEMRNTAAQSSTPASTVTNQSIQQNGQSIMKPTEKGKDVLIVDLTNDEAITPPEPHTNDEEVTQSPRSHTSDEEVVAPQSPTNDVEVIAPQSPTNDEEVIAPQSTTAGEEIISLQPPTNDEEVIAPQSTTVDQEVSQSESYIKESRKRKLQGCTSAISVMCDKLTEPNKQHWKKNIATPFIKGNSSIALYPPKTTLSLNDGAAASGSPVKGYVTRIDAKTNKKMRLPICLANGTNSRAPPPKKRLHTTVSDSPPTPPLTRRERRPTLLPPPKRKHDDSSDTSSLSSGEMEQDDERDNANGINPAFYPHVELRENQSQDNPPAPVSDADDCVVLDDDSQQPEEIQLLPTPIVNGQSKTPPVQSSSAAGLPSIAVPNGPPSEGSEKSDVSSEETIVDRASSDVSSSGEGQESDPEIMIVDENVTSTSAAGIPLPNSNSVQIIPNTTGNYQRDGGRAAEDQQGALSLPASLQQPVNDDSKFSEYRRQSVMESGKVALPEDKILEKRHESSLSCNDEDTDNGSQKDQDPQMPVLRLPIPVSPSNENGNANIEAPALILHPGDRVPSLNENGLATMDASQRLNTEEDEERDMGGIGGDEKSDEETERSHVVQRRSRRKRKKSTKLNGFTDEELQNMNGYGETDDEGFRNVADETLDVDVVSNAEGGNDEESRLDRKKQASQDQRWFRSEHINFPKLKITSGKLQEKYDRTKQDGFPLTQRSKKRGRPKKQRRSDTDTEGGWRDHSLHQSSSRPSAATDYYYSSNDDEPLINKKARTRSLSAMGHRSGDKQMLRYEENGNGEKLADRQPIPGPSQRFTLSQQSTSNDKTRPDVPVVISLSGDDDDDNNRYAEDNWPQLGDNGYGLPSNPADVSVYTERLSGVEDPDATTLVEFQSEHGSQASTTTTANSSSGSFRRRQLKRGIIVECPKCHREVSNHFLKRHQRSNRCDGQRPPRPVGGAMTDYENDNDSQTEAELDDDMNGDHLDHQQQRKRRGRPPGSKLGECKYCHKKMLQSSIRNHVLNTVCPESRAALNRGEYIDYYSQDDSQTEDEGWDQNDNEYSNDGGTVMPTSAPSFSPAPVARADFPAPAVRVNCPGCGMNMLRTSIRNHLNQKRCRGRPISFPAATATITSNSTSTNPNHSTTTTTNQNDDVVEGSGTGDGEQSQGYLTNKRQRSCRRVVRKYNCDDDEDDVESNIETEYDGYDRVVSSPLPPEQQIIEDCPYADCNYHPVDERDHQNHTNVEHPPGEGYPCNSCNRVYISPLNLEVHQKTHVPRIPYDATMVSYIKNPALQPRVVISNTDYSAARQAL